MTYERERAVAIEAVVEASRLCETIRTEMVSAETISKQDRSPVTIADFAAQASISLRLVRAFPADPLVGEEDTADLRADPIAGVRAKVARYVESYVPGVGVDGVLAAIERGRHAGGGSGRFWTLDPIDGTKGFLRGEQYAIALALIEEGEVVLGVLGCPRLPRVAAEPDGAQGCLFIAVRGEGAVQRSLDDPAETSIRTASISDPAHAVFCESVEAAHSSHSDAAGIAAFLGVSAPPLRMDSQAKYAAVARGDAAIYLRLPVLAGYAEKIWDHAAGYRIVREAGGVVADIHGRALDFGQGRTLAANTGVIATNGLLHASVLAAVHAIRPSRPAQTPR